MAMNSSADLPETVATLFREMKRLGLDTPGVGINFIDEDNQRYDIWNVGPVRGARPTTLGTETSALMSITT